MQPNKNLIIAAEVTNSSGDFGSLGPMLDEARRELAAAGVTGTPSLVLADAGFWHTEQMNEITARGNPGPDPSRLDTAQRPTPGQAQTAGTSTSCAKCSPARRARRSTNSARS